MGKRKFTAEQAREALLATGVSMLESVGPAGVATVSLAEAINRSGVPRPSAYRVFGGGDLDPQSAFQEDLVLRVVNMRPGIDAVMLTEQLAPLLQVANASDAPTSSEALSDLMVEVLRTAAETTVDTLLSDPAVSIYLSAMALVGGANPSERIAASIKSNRDERLHQYLPIYRDLLSTFGLRLRNGWTERDLDQVIFDATMGAVLAAKSSGQTSSGGQTASWLGATYVALIALATEPDSRRVVSAQPIEMLNVSPTEWLATA